MLEAVRSVIFNTAVGFSHLGHPSISLSVARIVQKPGIQASALDFISNTQRGKGKAREVNVYGPDTAQDFVTLSLDWSCTTRPTWCFRKTRSLMVKEAISLRRKISQRLQLPRFTLPSYHSSLRLDPLPHPLLRRHASATSLPAAPDPSQSEAIAPDIGFILDVPVETLQLDDALFALQDYVAVLPRSLNKSQEEKLLIACQKLIERIEMEYDSEMPVEDLQYWGKSAKGIIEVLRKRTSSKSPEDFLLKCLYARAIGLCGDIDVATKLAQSAFDFPVADDSRRQVLTAFEMLVKSLFLQKDAAAVAEYVVREWIYIGSHVTKSWKWHPVHVQMKGRSLRSVVHEVICQINNPHQFLQERKTWDYKSLKNLGQLLIYAYSTKGFALDAFRTVEQLKDMQIEPDNLLQLAVVRALVKEDVIGPAKELLASIPEDLTFRAYLSTSLYLWAHAGETAKATVYYDRLVELDTVNNVDIAMYMQAFATHGQTEKALEVFDAHFPVGEDGKRHPSPEVLHYSIMIYAHSRKGDIPGVNRWLDDISKAGMKPDVYVFTIILQGFALRGDIESITTLISQMQSMGVEPTNVTYGSVITLLAHRKDPVGAEAVYKRAIRSGIEPDRRMVAALINAHVRAGSWTGVIRAFDYLRHSPNRRHCLTIEVFNVVLKAYVLIGAPFRIVSQQFVKLENTRLKADSYTFALLIKSACDNGLMDVASDIFWEMDELSTRQGSHVQPNVYVFTMLIAGYLKAGEREKAQSVYEEMRSRGIEPTAVTYTTILNEYGSIGTEESIETAQQFIKSLMDGNKEWNRPTYKNASPISGIYQPLMQSYKRLDKPAEVERLFNEIIENGGEASLQAMSILLDTYRRDFNIRGVMDLWPQVFQLGLKLTRDHALFPGDEDDKRRYRFQGNILCPALSIYIDALSCAGYHDEIATVWKQFQVNHLMFDSHNWNHLAIALVRAGAPERAFQVLEEVLLPYQRQSHVLMSTRKLKPDSPLIFDDEDPETAPTHWTPGGDDPAPEVYGRGAEERGRASHLFGLDLSKYESWKAAAEFEGMAIPVSHESPESEQPDSPEKTEGLNEDQEEESEDIPESLVHGLHLLHTISPDWNVWAPHLYTLHVLRRVLEHLKKGSLVQRVLTAEEREESEQRHSQELPEESEEKRMAALDMFEHIKTTYPESFQLAMKASLHPPRRAAQRRVRQSGVEG